MRRFFERWISSRSARPTIVLENVPSQSGSCVFFHEGEYWECSSPYEVPAGINSILRVGGPVDLFDESQPLEGFAYIGDLSGEMTPWTRRSLDEGNAWCSYLPTDVAANLQLHTVLRGGSLYEEPPAQVTGATRSSRFRIGTAIREISLAHPDFGPRYFWLFESAGPRRVEDRGHPKDAAVVRLRDAPRTRGLWGWLNGER